MGYVQSAGQENIGHVVVKIQRSDFMVRSGKSKKGKTLEKKWKKAIEELEDEDYEAAEDDEDEDEDF